jgi:hypothetical protein
VDSQSTSIENTTADETTVGGGDVSTDQNATDATGGEGQQSSALTYKEAEVEEEMPEAPEVEEEVDEPVVKRTKKAEVPSAAPKAKLADVVSAWSDN